MSQPAPANVVAVNTRSQARNVLSALRPRQWTKNLLLFAGIVFAAKAGDAERWAEAFAAFAAYCGASSAAYLLNDIRDVNADRQHPVKRLRAIARGDVSPHAAARLAALLTGGALLVCVVLGPWSLACLVAFAALQAAYSLGLKHVVLLDVFAIAGLFVLRAVAGAVAVDVPISPWLLVCTGLLALFLALGKRRAELLLVGADATPGRPVLEGYSLALVDQLLSVVAAATIVAYALYTFTARDSKGLMVTIPFVVFGVFRYLLLLHRRARGEEPENVLLTDAPVLLTVAAWGLTCGVILAL